MNATLRIDYYQTIRGRVLRIAALAEDSALAPGSIERVEALGSTESLPFERSRKGLEVRLAEGIAGSIAVVLKIRGNGLV